MEQTLKGKLQAHAAALRYRHPSRGLRLIAIAGPAGKTTTARILTEMLQESGARVLTLTNQGCTFDGQRADLHAYDSSATSLQQSLAYGRSRNADFVVIELSHDLCEPSILSTLTLEMAIVTGENDDVKTLLTQSVEYVVVPSGFTLDDQNVAPHKAISYGDDVSSEAYIAGVKQLRRGTEIELIIDHQSKFDIATYLIGKANVRNIAAAASAAYVLAIDMSTLQEGVARLERAPGNFEYLPTNQPFLVAVDGVPTKQSLDMVITAARDVKKRRLLVAADTTVSAAEFAFLKQQSDRLVVVNPPDTEHAGIETAISNEEAYDIVARGAKKDDIVMLLGREYASVDPSTLQAYASSLVGPTS